MANNRISRGPFTSQFESQVGVRHGVSAVVFMNSGTSALECLLEAAKEHFGWPDGAEVVVPATTFIATVAIVRRAGLAPVLCDVELATGNIDVQKIGGSISRKTVALLPVHLLGRACDMTNLMSLADSFGLQVIEDCCEAFGVNYYGTPVGSFGIGGAISTYVCHHVSTGVGGAVLTNNSDIATICRSLMQHGRDPEYLSMDDDDGLDDAALSSMIRARYSFVRWGHSYRATELEAALGVAALEDYGKLNAVRTCIAHDIAVALYEWRDRIRSQVWPTGSSPLFYPIVCDTAETCAGLSEVFERSGIETRPMMPLLTQPIIVKMLAEQGRKPEDFPNAMALCERAFLIGCHPAVDEEAVEEIRKTTESYFTGNQK